MKKYFHISKRGATFKSVNVNTQLTNRAKKTWHNLNHTLHSKLFCTLPIMLCFLIIKTYNTKQFRCCCSARNIFAFNFESTLFQLLKNNYVCFFNYPPSSKNNDNFKIQQIEKQN